MTQVRAGKILYLGISDAPAWLIARANTLAEWRGWTAFAGLQVPYSLLQRDIERELLPMAEALGLTRGRLEPAGRRDPVGQVHRGGRGRAGHPRRSRQPQRAPARGRGHRGRGRRRPGRQPGPGRHRVDADPLPAIHPIVGARRLDQLLDNLGAAELELPAEALARLDAATEPDLGFPATFIRDTGPWVFGAAALTG